MLADALAYLPNDILVKVDRAAMAASLETRAPFLDYRVAVLAWQLPLALKLRDGAGKWALRKLLDRHVPRALIERPKAGFAMPIGPWLRGPLRAWADDLYVVEDISARTADPAEVEVAERVARMFPEAAYLRLDLLPGDGSPLISEVEAIEPSLFLHVADGAARRAAAVFASLGGTPAEEPR